jgi:hypothetical protein
MLTLAGLLVSFAANLAQRFGKVQLAEALKAAETEVKAASLLTAGVVRSVDMAKAALPPAAQSALTEALRAAQKREGIQPDVKRLVTELRSDPTSNGIEAVRSVVGLLQFGRK